MRGIDNKGVYLASSVGEVSKGMIPCIHYGVVDLDNNKVVHFNHKGVNIEDLSNSRRWNILDKAVDEESVKDRLDEVKSSQYDLFRNNCEHFARYIASGEKKSKQVALIILALIAGGLFLVVKDKN